MRINTLHIENFQGIRDATFDLGGHSASIYGDNGTGKTTVFNAITWLLFDRASTGAKNFTPKTRGPSGDLHHLEHMAEAQFIMDNGRLVQLRKVFHENYKKKRGAATAEFDGHSVDFYIDGVPVKEKEYTTTLQQLCGGADMMKMLTMPNYFPEEMAWDARRKILLDVCGDVTDSDVIAAHPELEELDTYLLMPGTTRQFYAVDEYKKIAAAQKAAINKQLQEIPGRIDEAQRAIPEVTGSIESITAELHQLEAEREQLTQRKATILAGNTATAEAKQRTAEADARVAEARAAYLTQASTANAGTNAAIGELQRQITAARGRMNDAAAEAARQGQLAERMATRRRELLEEYNAIQEEHWNDGYGFGDTSAATENALIYNGRLHKLDHVTFEIPMKDRKEDYLSPWRFTSSDGRFEMQFRPVLDRAACTDFKLLKSDQHQVFGTFTGTAVLDDGSALSVRDFFGFAEKVENKW